MTPTTCAQEWCRALVETLLPVDVNSGRPVRLECDDGALKAAAALIGESTNQASEKFVRCLRDEALIDPDHGLEPLATASDGDLPGYLPGLAVLVLAASRMRSDELGSMSAYYQRLGDLLELPLRSSWPQVRGVPELVKRFQDLASWMEVEEGGRRGLLELPKDAHPRVVGVPIHQALLRAGDRVVLGGFFERTARVIDLGWDPVHQLHEWGGRHRLSQPLLTALALPDMQPALAAALRSARRSWDGSTIDSSGLRLLPSRLTLHLPPLPFMLSATVPALSASTAATGPGGIAIELDAEASVQIPLQWLDEVAAGELVLDAGSERVRLLAGPTMLFEVTPTGVHSVAAAAADPVWALTCDPALIDSCDRNQRFPADLPGGWQIFCDVDPIALSPELRQRRGDEEGLLTGIRTVGGLRLGRGVWLLHHPPRVVAALPEPAPVTINGESHGYLDPGFELSLEHIADRKGSHRIEVGEQELVVELAAEGPRGGLGGLSIEVDPRKVFAGPLKTEHCGSATITGPIVYPADRERSWPLVVRHSSSVDAVDDDGTVRQLAPPPRQAWFEHVGIPDDAPWEIPNSDRVVWLCVDRPGRKSVIAHRPVNVPVTSDVLDLVEWYADAAEILDFSGGGAEERWARLVQAAEGGS